MAVVVERADERAEKRITRKRSQSCLRTDFCLKLGTIFIEFAALIFVGQPLCGCPMPVLDKEINIGHRHGSELGFCESLRH